MSYKFQDTGFPLEERVGDLISRLSLDEKIGLLSANQKAITRLGIAEYHAGAEGAHGIVDRQGGKATVFPQPLGLSSTWDRELLREAGSVIGEEARGFYEATGRRSFLSLFCPTIDMERDPRWGRNEEAYGEDPYLAGKLASELIQGIQGDHPFYVQAMTTPKHFYTNNYELERAYINSEVPARLKEEYYLKVFAYAFKEGKALSVMTAYNKINGVPGMINPEIQTLLREKWGCQGYFVSDGGAFRLLITEHRAFPAFAQGLAAALHAGMDVILDDSALVEDAARDALAQKLISEEDIDRAIAHTLAVRMRLGQFDADPSKNPYSGVTRQVICSEKNAALARKASREALVLLKNDGFLPLNREKTGRIAVIGQLGGENMPDWYSGNPPYEITPLRGIERAFPGSVIVYSDGCDTCALFSKKRGSWLRVLDDGSTAMDGDEGSRALFRVSDWGYGGFGFMDTKSRNYLGTTEEGELVCRSAALWGWFVRELFFLKGERFLPDGKRLPDSAAGVASAQSIYNKPYSAGAAERVNALLEELSIVRLTSGRERAAAAAKDADAVAVVLGNHTLVGARECIDRETLDLPESMAGLLAAVAEVNPNTVLCLAAGYPYAIGPQEKLARAVLFTSHGAQEVGTAIGEALAGDFSPAGRLSQTWYASSAGFPHINDYDIIKNRMTYLYTDRPALYSFGHGLSYTRFEYQDFSVIPWQGGIEAAVTVRNAGGQDGDEVAQLYFASTRTGIPRPRKQLCGFERFHLKRGEARRIVFRVPRAEFTYYDEAGKVLVPDDVPYRIFAGAGSEDIRAEAIVNIAQ
jgi:beta-glucosidase